MFEKSWWLITDSTFRKCFQHAGLPKNIEDPTNVEEDDEDLPIAMWIEKHKISSLSDYGTCISSKHVMTM